MRRVAILGLIAGISFGATAVSDEVRYFLSLEGLSNPNDTDSAAVAPTNFDDLIVDAGTYRFYIWAQLLTPGSDLKGVDLAFRTNYDGEIHEVNIWQNNFVPAVTTRWNTNGVPGVSTPSGNGQFVDPPPAVSVLEAGVTNGAFAAFDDQYVASRGAAVIGYIEVSGICCPDIDIIHQGTGFLNTSGNHRVYLGFDDFIGAPADTPGQPYDTPSFEANIGIPEPSSVILMVIGLAMYCRRNMVQS